MNFTDPIIVELDKKRALKFTMKSYRRAEAEINKQRGATPATYAGIDGLIMSGVRQGAFPLDLLAVLLWTALVDDDQKITVDRAYELIDASPMPRGKLGDLVWDALNATVWRSKANEAAGDEGKDKTEANGATDPFGPGPGATTGLTQ